MNRKYTALLFLILSSLYVDAYAYDVTIGVSGSLTDQTCNVKSDDLTKNIDFGELDTSVMNVVGNVSDPQKVTINLDCYGTVNNLAYMFSGDADSTNSDLLKVKGAPDGDSPIAQGLAVEVLKNMTTRIPLNTKQSLGSIGSSAASTYAFDFYLRYRTVSSPITPGNASSILFLDMYYE